jgi:predicted RNA-binding Zn ribbon-like protein
MKGVKLLFANDTEVALNAAVSLINTAKTDPDGLSHVTDLDAFVTEWGWTGLRRRDRAELEAVRALRPRLNHFWEIDRDAAVILVNGLLREYKALPQLAIHDHWDYHLHATPDDAPLADRMAVEAAMALVDVIRQDEYGRLQICAADDCDDVLVDLSKNRSRRFCSTSCSNRTNVAAFRARRAGAGRS